MHFILKSLASSRRSVVGTSSMTTLLLLCFLCCMGVTTSLIAPSKNVGVGVVVGVGRIGNNNNNNNPILLARGGVPSSTFHTKKNGLLHPILSIARGGGGSSSSSATTTQLQSSTPTMLATLNTFWKANPLIAAAIVCSTKAFLADLVAQWRQIRAANKILSNDQNDNDDDELCSVVTPTDATIDRERTNCNKNTQVDWRRTLAFVVYGALYQGMCQELIYNNFYTYLFGSETTPAVAVKKVLFDAIFHNALVCIPMAYCVKSFVFQYSLKKAIQQYIDDVIHHGLLFKYYTLWMPVNAMIFTIVPKHLRITVMATVSFFWMIILSTISSRNRQGDDEKETTITTTTTTTTTASTQN